MTESQLKEYIDQRFSSIEEQLNRIGSKFESYPTLQIIHLLLSPLQREVDRVTEEFKAYTQERARYEQQIKVAIMAAVISPFIAMIGTVITTLILRNGV